MKREILFKGKRVDNGEWIFGDLIQNDKHTSIRLKTYRANNGWLTYEVNPETVCQFTGLLDKNGNKIFEWDICIVESTFSLVGGTYKIFYDSSIAQFILVQMDEFNAINFNESYYYEIIGNIHD